MTHKMLSSIAVVVAMSLSPAAMAQTTINGTTISDQDMPGVQARCDELAAQNPAGGAPPMASEAGANDHGADQTAAGDANNAGGDSANGGSDDVDAGDLHAADANSSTSTSAPTSFDVSTLTIEMCRDAGLAK